MSRTTVITETHTLVGERKNYEAANVHRRSQGRIWSRSSLPRVLLDKETIVRGHQTCFEGRRQNNQITPLSVLTPSPRLWGLPPPSSLSLYFLNNCVFSRCLKDATEKHECSFFRVCWGLPGGRFERKQKWRHNINI